MTKINIGPDLLYTRSNEQFYKMRNHMWSTLGENWFVRGIQHCWSSEQLHGLSGTARKFFILDATYLGSNEEYETILNAFNRGFDVEVVFNNLTIRELKTKEDFINYNKGIEPMTTYVNTTAKMDMNRLVATIKMKQNLDAVIIQVGGNPEVVYNERTTVYELLATLCTNNIVFEYTGPKSEL